MTFKMKLPLCLVLLTLFNCDAFKFPLHASCKVEWNISITCANAQDKIVDIINTWNGPSNCEKGGEKCLYKLTSRSDTVVKATHKTPVKGYVDDLTFTFVPRSDNGCTLKGFSTSETWYALLDQGTNYCNLHNLVTGPYKLLEQTVPSPNDYLSRTASLLLFAKRCSGEVLNLTHFLATKKQPATVNAPSIPQQTVRSIEMLFIVCLPSISEQALFELNIYKS